MTNPDFITAHHRNYAFNESVSLPLKLKWKFRTRSKDIPIGRPLVADSRAWLLAPFGNTGAVFSPAMVYEIDALSGEKQWEFKIDSQTGWASQSCLWNNQFITSTKEDIIGIRQGEISFRANGLSNRTRSVVCDEKHLYCTGCDGLHKVDTNGDRVAAFHCDRPSSAALSKGKIFFGAGDSLFCLSTETMEPLWETDLSEVGKRYNRTKSRMLKKEVYTLGRLRGRYPVVCSEKIFCDLGRCIICLSLDTGDVLWKSEASGDPVHTMDKLVSYDQSGRFHCLNPETGEMLYQSIPVKIRGAQASMPFVSENTLFVGSDHIMAIDVNNGRCRWEFQAHQASAFFFDPVYIDGHLYSGCTDGNLYCFSHQ